MAVSGQPESNRLDLRPKRSGSSNALYPESGWPESNRLDLVPETSESSDALHPVIAANPSSWI